MAVQLHVAHSSTVSGVGVIAAGPYYCAQGSLRKALYHCVRPSWWRPLPDPRDLKSISDALAREGAIDGVGNLSPSRVWLFSGTQDETVQPEVVRALQRFYALYGVDARLVDHIGAGHAMVTLDAGHDCGATKAPYLNDCDFDAAGALLQHLLGKLRQPDETASGSLREFDQRPYARAAGMAEKGYVYVPQACASGACRVHVALHGCRQSARQVGERFVREAGYNRWAAANRLIVLYPQVEASESPLAFNPRACWDWWGYTGPAYHTKEAPQIRAVMAMVAKLGAAPE